MKTFRLISTGVLFLLLGTVAPTYAQQEQHEQEAKPEKQQQQAKPERQQEAKPAKQEQQQQAKPEKQQQAKAAKPEQQAKPEKQQQARAARPQQQAKPEKQQQARVAKPEHQQPAKGQRPAQAQGQWARNGQKDSRGHVYSESRFGRDHHARFEENGGRFYNGRREYSYGGYWFYAGVYPPWFYQQQVYFIMGADGLWYAVAYDNPSLTFQVNIE
jgi:hypothetical protein